MAAPNWKPEGMHAVTPDLSIDGCAEAIELYKKVFGAKEMGRAPDPSGKKIWHADIQIGDSRVFLADVFPEMGGKPGRAQLWLYLEDADGTFNKAVESGFKVLMPMGDMFWGDRIGKVADRWGNEWTLAKRIKDMTREEMKKAQDAFVASQKR
ncbi:MAG: VOC family protein [Deltaproteobacteria bacterium]